MKIDFIFLFFILIHPIVARAQTTSSFYRMGVIACPEKVELIDYFEGGKIKDIAYPQKITPDQIIQNFRDLMPDRAIQYSRDLELFEQIKRVTSSQPSESIDRTDLVIKPPEGCDVFTLIKTDFVRVLDIQSDLWKQMKRTDQSGAILHWLLAKEVYDSVGEFPKGSIYIRNINSLLPTPQLKELPLESLTNILKSAQLPSLRRQGVLVDLREGFYIGNNQFLNATPIDRSTWSPPLLDHNNLSTKLPLLKAAPVGFYPTGSIRSLRVYDTLSVSTSGGILPFSTPDHVVQSPFPDEENPRLYFNTNGSVSRGSVFTAAKFQTHNLKLVLAQHRGRFDRFTYSLLTFWPNGLIQTITNSTGSLFAFGKWLRIQKGGAITLHETGVFREFISLDPFDFNVQGLATQWTGHVMIYPDGTLECAYLVHKQVLKTTSNTIKTYSKDQQVCFDRSGLAIP